MKEEWKFIDGYNNEYAVSNIGRVKSFKRYKDGKILSPIKDYFGYIVVNLRKDNNRKMVKVHRLVMQAFTENTNNLRCVNHIDENKTNNNINNLEWCTYIYNNNYGTKKQRSAEKQSMKIVQLSKDGSIIKVWDSIKGCGRESGYNYQNIISCCKHRIKTAYGYKWEYFSN